MSKTTTNQEIFIVAARRTPVGSFMGALSSVSAPNLGAAAIQGLFSDLGEGAKESCQALFMGNVLTAGVGQAPARQAGIFSGLSNEVPAMTVNKVCGSGLQAVILASQGIALGDFDAAIAGGQENMSQAPFLVPNVRNGLRLGHGSLVDSMVNDGLWDVYNQMHMGSCAELCAREQKITREEQDTYSIESFKRAQEAQRKGWFRDEIAPVLVKTKKGELEVFEDEGPGKANFEKMPQLKPVFDPKGSITAANASSINDGGAALYLASGSKVKEMGWKPIAKLIAYAGNAHQPEWFTTAPIGAIEKVLKKSGWKAEDVDRWEVNEAFAVVALAAQRAFQIPSERFNARGGAIALGHPIGASGARILVTLLSELQTTGLKKGVAGICIGGGEALALAVERL